MPEQKPPGGDAGKLAEAVRHGQAGRHGQARAIYTGIVESDPGNGAALHGLGLLRAQAGQFDEAIGLLTRAVAADAENALFEMNRGNVLHLLKRTDEAIESYRRALGLDPDLAAASANLGVALQARGRHQEAESAFRAGIEAEPGLAAAHNGLGLALQAMGRMKEAEAAFRRAAGLDPDNPLAQRNLGLALLALGQPREALPVCQRAVQLQPDAQARDVLARCLVGLGRFGEAAEQARQAIAAQPDWAPAQISLGAALEELDDTRGALAAYGFAVSAEPGDADARGRLANLLERTNRLDQARRAADEGLAATPDDPLLNLVAARCERRAGEAEAAIARLEAHAACGTRADFNYELGGLLDRAGDSDRAFACFARANRLASESPAAARVDRRAFPSLLERLADRCTPAWRRSWRGDGEAAASAVANAAERPAPVFLVGFPRSGTTLLERILARHPGVATLEEKPLLAAVENRLAALPGGYPDALPGLSGADLENLRRCYYRAVEQHGGGAGDALLIDKLPLNLCHAALILRLFPGARFIFAARHPCDAVLSCFMREFEVTEAMIHFLGLDTATALYVQVLDLWRQYQRVLSPNVHVVRYEGMVEDAERELRPLVEFLGLDWDDRVLDAGVSQGATRRIRTPSYDQATQAVYGHARFRWRRYAGHLEAVSERLAPYAEALGYEAAD